METTQADAQSDWRIKMLFDGQCPLCSREASLLHKHDAAGQIAFEDIASPEFDPAKYGLTMAEVMGAMHGIRRDGSVVRGIDALAEFYDAVGWNWLAAPLRWPLTRPIAKVGYRIFAAIRPRLSGLKPVDCRGACKRVV